MKDPPQLRFRNPLRLGANLARAEGQEMFAGLIRRFSSVQQAGELEQRGRMTLRGFKTVPVSVTER